MRFVLTLLLSLLTLLSTVGQTILSEKPTRTVFSIKAVDDGTSAELPTQFTIQARLAKKNFVGRSQPGKSFDFVLTRTDTLNVIANAPGYNEVEELMVVSCDTCPDYEYIVRLEKKQPRLSEPDPSANADSVFRNLTVNQAFRLDNVYFDQSSYVLRPESYPQLDKLAKTLATTPGLIIEIAGHTDNVGDRQLNQALSENRAKIIRNYLIRTGIVESRLRPNGYGHKAPGGSERFGRK